MTAPTDEEVRKIAELLSATWKDTEVGKLARWCLSRLSAGSGWRLVSELNVPKGTWFLASPGVYKVDMVCIWGFRDDGSPKFEGWGGNSCNPTHFMSLPSPPGEG